MSTNNSQAVSELIKLLLSQQQQQLLHHQPSAPTLSYQPQPEMPPPAQAQTSTISSLNQLMGFLQTSGSNTAPAPTAPKPSPDDIHAQLQRYLQGGNQNQADIDAVAQVSSPAFQNNVTAGGLGGNNQNWYLSQPPRAQQQQQVQQPQQPQVQQQSIQPLLQALSQQNVNIGVQQQQLQQQEANLLSNIKLLAKIDPGMAAAALSQALNMPTPAQGPREQQPMQPQNQAHQTRQPLDLQPIQHQAQQILGAQAPSPFVTSHQLQNHHPAAATFCSPSLNQGLTSSEGIMASLNPKPSDVNQKQGLKTAGRTKKLEQGEADILAEKHQEAKVDQKRPAKKDSKDKSTKKLSGSAKNIHKGSANTGSKPAPSMAAVPLPAATAVPPSIPIHTPAESVLQHWNLEKLETHVTQLKRAGQHVPRHAALLLFNARRREERLKAKRISNRKSASVLRARKKEFIERMMKSNSTMKKKAAILQKMPDLVIAIKLNGQITFCGSQVEHFLKYKYEDLLEANIRDLVVPESRRTLQRLIRDLLHPGPKQQVIEEGGSGSSSRRTDDADGKGSNSRSSDANVVSEKSFPMLEVNVDAMQEPSNTGDDVSDSSSGENCRKRKHVNKGNGVSTDFSSLTRQKSSFADSSCGNYDSGESRSNKKVKIAEKIDPDGRLSSNNTTSSKTSDESQPDGIRGHKEHGRMALKPSVKISVTDSCPSRNTQKKGEDEADDSGYTESNESPEDSYSSFDSSRNERGENRRKRRLVPVYKVRFVCNDLTTIWCELTASFCSKSVSGDDSSFDAKAALAAINNPRGLKSLEEKSEPEEEEEEDELLLCVRITYRGKRVSQDLRFVPKGKAVTEGEYSTTTSDQKSSSTPTSSSVNEVSGLSAGEETKQSSPLKKRPIANDTEASSLPSKKEKATSSNGQDVKAAQSLLDFHSKQKE